MAWTTVILYTISTLFAVKYLIRFIRKTFYFGSIDRSNEVNVKGKIVIVTGANTGIGKATAHEIAERGATVILACRNLDATNKAIADIEKKTRNGKLVAMKLDLSSLQSVRDFVSDFQKKYDRLDILINNAGVLMPVSEKAKTKDGFELNFGVNHLGHFLLTNLLLDTIKKSAPARIINLSSTAHLWNKLDLNNVSGDKPNLSPSVMFNELYADSKMANVLFTKELGKRLEGTGIQTYTLCPGLVKTDGLRNQSAPLQAFLNVLLDIIGKDVYQGSQTTLFCALSKHEDVVGKTGEMYRECAYWKPEKRVPVKDEDALKLWHISEKMVGLKQD